MTAKVPYAEGDWFGVPLMDGGYSIGVVARSSRRGILFGYFFGPARREVPEIRDTSRLAPDDAVLIGMFGHLGLLAGDWPRIGRSPNWDRMRWPMPTFVRYEELTGRTFHVRYDDADPAKRLGEVLVPPGVDEQGPKDSLMGAGFVEALLTRLLGAPAY